MDLSILLPKTVGNLLGYADRGSKPLPTWLDSVTLPDMQYQEDQQFSFNSLPSQPDNQDVNGIFASKIMSGYELTSRYYPGKVRDLEIKEPVFN